MLPAFDRLMIKSEQARFVLEQDFNCFRIYGLETLLNSNGCGSGFQFGLVPIDVVHQLFSALLNGFLHFIQHIGRLVHPTPLPLGCRIDLTERLPEAERSVANAKFRRGHAPFLHISQQFDP